MCLARCSFAVLIGLLALAAATPVFAYSSFPPTDHVGVPWPVTPPARRSCSTCHTGFSGLGSVALQGLPLAWEEGRTYSLLVELVDPGAVLFGFELIALDPGFAAGGLLVPRDPGTSSLVDPDRLLPFLLQTAAGNSCTLCPGSDGRAWSVDWEAPASGTGAVSFYLCGNGGDGSGTPFGDRVYCRVETVPELACAPPLPPVTGLQAAPGGLDISWSWNALAGADRGYRLYAVGAKEMIPAANASTPTAARVCAAASAFETRCSEPGAMADPGPLFYQLVGVCAAGLEGPN